MSIPRPYHRIRKEQTNMSGLNRRTRGWHTTTRQRRMKRETQRNVKAPWISRRVTSYGLSARCSSCSGRCSLRAGYGGGPKHKISVTSEKEFETKVIKNALSLKGWIWPKQNQLWLARNLPWRAPPELKTARAWLRATHHFWFARASLIWPTRTSYAQTFFPN